MERIESFRIDHEKLEAGLYVSRLDKQGETYVTTFDLRLIRPNREPVMDMPAVHTVEHLGATFLRNSPGRDEVIYFGPMGCRTGFYLVMFGRLTSEDVYELVKGMCAFILAFEGPIPGASPKECGNWSEQNLDMAKYYVSRYLEALKKKRFVYPE